MRLQGAIMTKRKKQSKVQKRGKLPRKVSKSAAKLKRATVKKAAQKEVAPAVETVEHPDQLISALKQD
jgi:hypothetical protein